jgi:hypothetical protein
MKPGLNTTPVKGDVGSIYEKKTTKFEGKKSQDKFEKKI